MIELKGIAASPGIAIGRAFFLDMEDFAVKKHLVQESGVREELSRFDAAIEESKRQMEDLKGRVTLSIGVRNALIFDAHLLLLIDPNYIEKIREMVRSQRFNVEYAVWAATEEITREFMNSRDAMLKERAVDIHDVGMRILHNLLGVERLELASLKDEVIVVATDLAPSDTAQMRKEKVIAFVTDMGGRTSHTAIMARSLEIPAVVGLKDITQKTEPGDLLVIDGNSGTVIVNPEESVLEYYRKERERFHAREIELVSLKELPAVTVDGHRIKLMANIEVPEEVGAAMRFGAEGIGLYRTEFLYLNRDDLPGEEEQFNAYKSVADFVKPLPVVIRTLDLGGDKFLSQTDMAPEINPSLGCRGIRFCLENEGIFRVHLRAILRASVHGNLKIMYPLISGIDELRRANGVLESVKNELSAQGIGFNRNIEVGVMIEVPSAVMISDMLAKEVKFFSIGTNDLIQYTLGIDRVNEKIAYLYEPLHPAVLRLIQMVVSSAHSAGIEITLCGEMAADPLFVPILAGMGIDILSMGPLSIPEVKQVIKNTMMNEARDLAGKVVNFSSAKDVEEFLKM